MVQNKDQAKEKEVFITHECNAAREIVFNAWTDPDILKKWYAPDGCTIDFKSIDVKQGGTFHSCIHNPQYGDCWCKGVYLEVVFPERLVFSMILTDEHGNDVTATQAGKQSDWPEALITTIEFTAMGDKSSFTLHQTTPENLAKQTGAYQSWFDMFNNLDTVVNK